MTSFVPSSHWSKVVGKAARKEPPSPRMAGLCPHAPSDKQQVFLALDCLEALYGGAAGGGKSEALLMAALQHAHVPGYAALILRKDTQRLMLAGGLIPRSHEWLSGKATWNAGRRQWSFETGGPPATISFGYLAHPFDKFRYGSSEYQYIAFDELTEFLEDDYLFLFSRLRKTQGLAVPLRMRSASNPGGVGHLWVKRRFVQASGVRNQESGTGNPGQDLLTPDPCLLTPGVLWTAGRAFVPARIADNPALNAEEYLHSLSHLPPVFRERLMNGDWSVQEQGVFRAEWLRYYSVVGQMDSPTEQLEIHDGRGSLIAAIPVAHMRRFSTIDPAGTSRDKAREARGRPASHSVIQVWDQPRGPAAKYLFLRHLWRGQVGFDGLCKVIREVHARWRPERMWIENEKLGQAAVDQLGKDLPLETIPTGGRDKMTRAAPLILKFERGEILLPQLNTTWRQEFESELLSWTGRDDQPSDQIDAAAYAAIIAGTAPGVLQIQPVV